MPLASQGAQSNLAMDAATPVDGSSEPFEFKSFGIKKLATIIGDEGIRGTRSHSKERTRDGIYTVGGPIVLEPSPIDLDKLLPRILGAAESTDTFALAETLPSFSVGVDLVADAFEYTDCYVNRAIFRGTPGGLLELELDILGKTQIDLSYPSLTLGVATNDVPYTYQEGVCTLNALARDIISFELTIDNFLEARFTNSLTSTSITPQDRLITLKTVTPYTSGEINLYTQSTAGTSGSLVFTNSGLSTTFTFANLQPPQDTPVVTGKTEITMELTHVARRSGATLELVITSDSVA